MSNAVWIPGYEGRYKISDDGFVLSFVRKKGKPLKGVLNPWGYLAVFLYTETGYAQIRVHRLVAKAFCPGFKDGFIVNHKNGIKTDNRAVNLEWVTYGENTRHAIKNGLLTFRRYPVLATHRKTGAKIEFQNIHEASRGIGATARSVQRVLSGLRKSCRGYVISRV